MIGYFLRYDTPFVLLTTPLVFVRECKLTHALIHLSVQ